MRCRSFFTVMVFTAGLIAPAVARAVTLQPNEAASKDTFDYQFLPTFNFNSPPFGALLSAGKTGIGHDTESLVQFDLSGVGLSAAQVSQATFQAWATRATAAGFGADPDPAHPIQIDLYAVAGAAPSWDEATATWNNRPTTGALIASATMTGINQTVTWDVTTLVQQWLSGALPNNGILLRENAVVGTDPNFVVSVFDSSSGQHAPVLNIVPVPEPNSVTLMLGALPALAFTAGRVARRRA